MRKLAWITAVFLTVSAWIDFATGPTYSQRLSLTSTLAAAVTINPTVASESEQAISILSLPWDQDEIAAVQAPRSASPLPDKFLFAIGAQAPVGQFNYPFGIAFALDGTIYVADTNNDRIQRFSSTGLVLGTWGARGVGEGQFLRPHAVAIAPNGWVYVADSDNHRIQYFSPEGQFLGQWGRLGGADGEFANPYGIAVAADSTVFVADSNNHRIQRFDPYGNFLLTWGSYGEDDGQFHSPHGVLPAADGTVYVTDYRHQVQRFTAEGAFIGKWGNPGTGDGQFDGPTGIAMGPNGVIYVADRWNNRVQQFSATGEYLGEWGGSGDGDGQFWRPTGIAIAPTGTIYVTDSENDRLQYFTDAGAYLGQWGSRGMSDGQFNEAASVTRTDSGHIYVADRWNHRIQQFDAAGNFVRQWNRGFFGPRGIANDSAGNIYVADSGNHRIQKFTGDGTFDREWGSWGGDDGQFREPIGVAVGRDGTVYVADCNNHRIQRFNSEGQFLSKWGEEGSEDGQFRCPYGVAVAPDDTVYVADSGNHRIQRFSAEGQFLQKWGSGGNGDSQFNWPKGIEVTIDGTVYVVDTGNHRIQRFTSTGAFLDKWGNYGLNNGSLLWLSDIAVAPDGTVYITSDNYLQVFGPAYPATWRGEFFANRWLAERPVFIQNYTSLNFQWYDGSPAGSVPADNFSSRFQRTVWFEASTYRFMVSADDGVRLWVDDRLLIEQWQDQVATFQADVALDQGYHRIRVEHYEHLGGASLALSWQDLSDPYEPDNTCASARDITVNGPAQTHNFHTTTDEEWVKFNASANYRYIIETSNLGDNADTVMELYQGDCSTMLTWDDDSGPGLGSRITWDAVANGVLYVRVHPFSSSRTGPGSSYDLTVTGVAPTPQVTPTALSADLPFGGSLVQTLILSNPSTRTVTFTATDVETGRPAALGFILQTRDASDGRPLSMPVNKVLNATLQGDTNSNLVEPSTLAYRYEGVTSLPRILVYSDDYFSMPGNTYVEQALRWLGLSYTGHYADCAGFGADLNAGGWDVVLISHNNYYCVNSYWNAVEAHLRGGGKTAIETYDIGGTQTTTTLWSTLGLASAADLTAPAPVYRWATTDRLFTAPRSVPNITDIGDYYFDNGDRLRVSGATVAKAGFTSSPQADQAAIAVALEGRAIVDSWIVSEARADQDADGMLDGIELWINQISYLTGATGQDAPWLTETSSGAIPAGGQFQVIVSYDATGLAPGVYYAAILLAHDGNVISPLVVPVTMTVREPTPTPTPSPSFTPTPTPTPSFTPTPTPTPTPSFTPTPTPTRTRTATPPARHVHLPLLLRQPSPTSPPVPAAPELDPITPPEGNPQYAVRWSAAARAESYVLERATNLAFTDAVPLYTGPATHYTAASQGIATYHYRVKARNQGGDGPWSNTQAVEVRWEQEPNNAYTEANGPLISGKRYYGYPETINDYYYFVTNSAGEIRVEIANHSAQGGQLVLWYQSTDLPGNRKGNCAATPGCTLTHNGPAGRYYVQVYTAEGHNTAAPYTLQVVYP